MKIENTGEKRVATHENNAAAHNENEAKFGTFASSKMGTWKVFRASKSYYKNNARRTMYKTPKK